MVDPQLLPGTVKVIVACPFHHVATTFVGLSGTVAGIIELLGLDAGLVPKALVAVTVKV